MKREATLDAILATITRGAAASGHDLDAHRVAGVAPPSSARSLVPPPPSPRVINRPLPPRSPEARAARRARAARALLALAIVSRPRPPSPARIDFLTKAQARPDCHDFAPLSFEAPAYALASTFMEDRTGETVQAALDVYGPAVVAAVTRGALCDVDESDPERPRLGPPVRTWRSPVARRRAMFWIGVLRLSSSTTRKGMIARLEGYARGTWAVLAPDLGTGEKPSRRTLDDDFRALRLAGALYIEQPPAHRAPRWTVGRDREGRRRALAVYYVPARLLGSRRARAAAAAAELAVEHEDGAELPSYPNTRSTRRASRGGPPRPPDIGALYAPRTL